MRCFQYLLLKYIRRWVNERHYLSSRGRSATSNLAVRSVRRTIQRTARTRICFSALPTPMRILLFIKMLDQMAKIMTVTMSHFAGVVTLKTYIHTVFQPLSDNVSVCLCLVMIKTHLLVLSDPSTLTSSNFSTERVTSHLCSDKQVIHQIQFSLSLLSNLFIFTSHSEHINYKMENLMGKQVNIEANSSSYIQCHIFFKFKANVYFQFYFGASN